MMIRKILKRLVTPPLAFVGVLLLLIEEKLWHGLVRLGEWTGTLPLVRNVERRIANLPPYGAVAALFGPALLILPVKLAAVWFVTKGHVASGLMVLLGAKITATAIVARIYTLCEPALEMVPWFVRMRDAILRGKDWAHRKLEAFVGWQSVKELRDWLNRQRLELWHSLQKWSRSLLS